MNALNKALEISDDGEDEEEHGHARDNTISALGKIIKFQHQHIDVNVLVPQWLNLLPLKWDPKEATAQHELLVEILQKNPILILGADNANLPKVLRILALVYETKFSEDELDKNILSVFANVKQNPNLAQYVTAAKENCESKILKKLNIHFP